MKTFKLLTLMAAVSMMLFSCSQETVDLGLDPLKEAVNEVESFTLEESGFTITEAQALGSAYDDMYTAGILEYAKNGNVMATVDFGNGTDANMARLIRDGLVTDFPLDRENDGRHRDGCFRFVYPLTYIMPDGSTVTGENKAEIHAAFREWYEAHPDVEQRPELHFPVQIAYRNHDEPVTINNYEELHRAYEACDDRPETDCNGRFIRRVVLPLVRTEDCGREPVAGIIKFFKCRSHEWVATIDFGEGQCDDLAIKITEDGVTEFVISEWFD